MSNVIVKLKKYRAVIGLIFFTIIGLVCVVAGLYAEVLESFMLTDKEAKINWYLVGFGGLCVFGGIRSVFISLKRSAKKKLENE